MNIIALIAIAIVVAAMCTWVWHEAKNAPIVDENGNIVEDNIKESK